MRPVVPGVLVIVAFVPSLLVCADAVVFPSELEGFPHAAIEAALQERPIIACDVPGVRDDRKALLGPPRHPGELASGRVEPGLFKPFFERDAC
jgi:glycosyltransferase involved in cell wall biosynthesis